MKKLFLLLLILATTEVVSAGTFTKLAMIPGVTDVQAANPAAGGMFQGSIGGDDGCVLQMPDGAVPGYYTFLNYSRITRFGSYNSKTHTLIINAYEERSGKYVGKFVGKLTEFKLGYHHYKGVFTNTKGGKVNFDLWETPMTNPW